MTVTLGVLGGVCLWDEPSGAGVTLGVFMVVCSWDSPSGMVDTIHVGVNEVLVVRAMILLLVGLSLLGIVCMVAVLVDNNTFVSSVGIQAHEERQASMMDRLAQINMMHSPIFTSDFCTRQTRE